MVAATQPGNIEPVGALRPRTRARTLGKRTRGGYTWGGG